VTSRTAIELLSGALVALAFVTACGSSDDPVVRAIEHSQEAFGVAKRQGVDLQRIPCIYYPNDDVESWFAFVVFPEDGPPREAAKKCPGGESLGYVALDPRGEVVEVTGIPRDWRELQP
jgi:hypothetical protein